jgi:hypothetical protein
MGFCCFPHAPGPPPSTRYMPHQVAKIFVAATFQPETGAMMALWPPCTCITPSNVPHWFWSLAQVRFEQPFFYRSARLDSRVGRCCSVCVAVCWVLGYSKWFTCKCWPWSWDDHHISAHRRMLELQWNFLEFFSAILTEVWSEHYRRDNLVCWSALNRICVEW